MKNYKNLLSMTIMVGICVLFPLTVQAEEIEKENYEIEMSSEEECVIIDNDDCTMKMVSIDSEGEWGYTWNVYLENKTDVELMFDLADVSVNGMMCDPYWAVTVEGGKAANEEIIWDLEQFEEYGIDDVTVVEFTLSVYNNDDWEAGNLVYNDYKIYLNGKDAAVMLNREPEATDVVLLDSEECSMVSLGIMEDEIWGTELKVYFENKSERDLLISFEDVSVNGMMCDPYWGMVVTAGNNAYADISWMEEDLEENGIEVIEEVQGTMLVYDNDDWEADALVEETITVNAE